MLCTILKWFSNVDHVFLQNFTKLTRRISCMFSMTRDRFLSSKLNISTIAESPPFIFPSIPNGCVIVCLYVGDMIDRTDSVWDTFSCVVDKTLWTTNIYSTNTDTGCRFITPSYKTNWWSILPRKLFRHTVSTVRSDAYKSQAWTQTIQYPILPCYYGICQQEGRKI
jgi:hypothetical protein